MFRVFIVTVFVCLVAGDQSRLEFLRDLLKEVRSLGEVKREYGGLFVDGEADKVLENYSELLEGNLAWLTVVYEGKKVKAGPTGVGYDSFLELLEDGNRLYALVAVECAGTTSNALIRWIGPSVSPLKKAKTSTDVAFVKQLLSQFRKELLADTIGEVSKTEVCKIMEQTVATGYNKGSGK